MYMHIHTERGRKSKKAREQERQRQKQRQKEKEREKAKVLTAEDVVREIKKGKIIMTPKSQIRKTNSSENSVHLP